MVRLLLRLRALYQIERFLRGRPLVHDRPDPADHADRIRGLPDVPSHVDAARPLLDRLIRELEGIERSEEHTSELQSLAYLVCRLLLEKKKPEHVVHALLV